MRFSVHMKILVSLTLSLAIVFDLFSLPVLAVQDTAGKIQNTIQMDVNNPYMIVNGATQEIDPGRGTTPQIINSRTLVPIRAIIESMGGTVEWETASEKITLTVNGHIISMWLNKKELAVDGKSQIMDVVPVSINGRTMVPVRFAAENAGCEVEWIESTKTVFLVYYTNQPVWIDETNQNPNALFRLGMTRDEVKKAAASVNIAIRGEYEDFIDAPPVFFSFTGNRVDLIGWDHDLRMNIPSINGFGYRSTINDVEKTLGKPLAANAQDTSIIFLYQTGGQYAEFYADIKSPHRIERFHTASSLKKCIANPDYNEYEMIKSYLSGN